MAQNLFDQVIEMTKLPKGPLRKDLLKYLDREGIRSDDLTIDDLRKIMIKYLSETVEDTLV